MVDLWGTASLCPSHPFYFLVSVLACPNVASRPRMLRKQAVSAMEIDTPNADPLSRWLKTA
jgi:hypothetical protein